MDWSAIGQGLATGLGAALPVGVGIVWVIRKVFKLGRWKETLATKRDLSALQQATKQDIDALQQATKRDIDALQQATKRDIDALQQANEEAHVEISRRIDDTRADLAELRSAVAGLASSVEATRSDVGRIVDHLLSTKQT